jgi:multidrug resistance efflux pump
MTGDSRGLAREDETTVRGTGSRPRFERRILPLVATGTTTIVATILAIATWQAYADGLWTRDATVRAYVIDETPEVSGRIIALPVRADQFVHKGDLLMEIEPTDYQIAVDDAQAAVAQANESLADRRAEAARRRELSTLSTSVEEQQNFSAAAAVAQATYDQTLTKLAQARVNLARARIVSATNGYVTNLTAQVGDYAVAGHQALAIVDGDSFWVEAYFEETLIDDIQPGTPASVRLMGSDTVLRGHVVSLARGISVSNAQADSSGLASVNPVFTWIRLAQRVPVRIALDDVSPAVTLTVGRTASVELTPTHPRPTIFSLLRRIIGGNDRSRISGQTAPPRWRQSRFASERYAE